MPIFRVFQAGGEETIVQASRVVTDGANICFETQVEGRWRSVLSVPAGRVTRLQRRINEEAGWRWIIARPMPVVGNHVHY